MISIRNTIKLISFKGFLHFTKAYKIFYLLDENYILTDVFVEQTMNPLKFMFFFFKRGCNCKIKARKDYYKLKMEKKLS